MPVPHAMTVRRSDGAVIAYLQAVPGENLHAKPFIGTKTWRKPGQINNYHVGKKRKYRNQKKEEPFGRWNVG